MADVTTLDADNTIVGTANAAGIWIAAEGTAGPADTTTAWPAGFSTLGYVHDDGVTVGVELESEDLKAWQSKAPLRTVITGKALTVGAVLLEVTPQSVALYFDEDAPTPDSEGAFKVTVSDSGKGNRYAIGIDVKDGDMVVRYYFPSATLSENDDIEIKTSDFAGMGVTLKALSYNGTLAVIDVGPATAA